MWAPATAQALRLTLNAGSDHTLSKQGAACGSPFCIEQGRLHHPAFKPDTSTTPESHRETHTGASCELTAQGRKVALEALAGPLRTPARQAQQQQQQRRPFSPLFEVQRSPKVLGVSFVSHGTLFARGHHRGHQKCPRQTQVAVVKLLLSLVSVC